MGENYVISGTMHMCFQSEGCTKDNVILFMKANLCPILPYGC